MQTDFMDLIAPIEIVLTIVTIMVIVKMEHASVMMDTLVTFVSIDLVKMNVVSKVNAEVMELVYVIKDLLEMTAHFLTV